MNLSRSPRVDRQIDLPHTELPAEGRGRYLEYVVEEIATKLETSSPGEPEIFGIEITAFTTRQQEIDLITLLQARGVDIKLTGRPRHNAKSPLYWFLAKKLQ